MRWLGDNLLGELDVEVSDSPLAAGRAVRGSVTPRGGCRLGRVRLSLVCRESVTSTDCEGGSDTANRDVARVPVGDPTRDGSALPLVALTVPPGAMNPVSAPNASIAWRVRVSGRVCGFLRFRRDYATAVGPGAGAG